MKLFAAALLALTVAVHAGPRNNVAVSSDDAQSSSIVGQKGAMETLSELNDADYVHVCNGLECTMMRVDSAKGEVTKASDSITVAPIRGDQSLTKALQPSISTMSESIKGLMQQRTLLEQLEASMAALTSASSKGQQLAAQTKGRYAASFHNAALAPPSKGYAASPSKGQGTAAATMQLEAAMCPMLMYELAKSQKVSSERKVQLDAAVSMNANLLAQKQRLESALAAALAGKSAAEQQAAFNAKYAAEQKSRAEIAEAGLASCEADKAALTEAKENLEIVLAHTQDALAEERQRNVELTDALRVCNEEKAALQVSLEEEIARAEAAEADLAETRAALEVETEARIICEEDLSFTTRRLEKSEADLESERAAREQTEEELMRTMTDLASCQRELRVTSEILSRTQDELQDKTQAYARELAAREALELKVASLTEEIRGLEQALRDSQRALEDEQNAHSRTRRQYNQCQEELASTEAARQALEVAKQELEDELAETKAQLEVMTSERDQLQISLENCNSALEDCTNARLTCEANLADEKTITEQLTSQLTDALDMLKVEKEAREQLTVTIAEVQIAAMAVQKEVEKLQFENLVLQQQIEKLKSEQEVALAMAAGCPPTYEKFGSSCYKYIREKTQWKMAQEQCMKDSGNLVSLESVQEQIFVTDYLKRLDANDAYAYTSGYKTALGWKWKGAADNHMGASGVEFWYDYTMKSKPGYDCQALLLTDSRKYGEWLALPCYSAAHYICEYSLLPPGTVAPSNPAEDMAILEMARAAPAYLQNAVRRA